MQWHSQDEQVMWAQHGHTKHVCNTHLLGNLGHAPAMKLYTLKNLLTLFLATNTIHSVLPACSLYVRMKLAIAHANKYDMYIHVCSGVATPGHTRACAYIKIIWKAKFKGQVLAYVQVSGNQ